MRSEFDSVPFQDRAKAEANLERLERRLAPALTGPLASLLAGSPAPDEALNFLERYVESAPAEVLAEIARRRTALTYLVAIFGFSSSLAQSFLAEPELPVLFARDRHFTRLKSRDELMEDFARFSTTHPDQWLASLLARFKRRNYLRIVLKDVLKLSTLAETTQELSALADVILTRALVYCDQELERRHGEPRYRDGQGRIARSGFSVISLGKLGGDELNYSSDIDLLFLYSHDGETSGTHDPGSPISNKEYFVHLAHAITRTLTQSTPHGQVFRVDLRLRPEGDQGELTLPLAAAVTYYRERARTWELQMLIKARHSAGDPRLTQEFLRAVEPSVYASPTDFEAVESVLWSRDKLSKRLRDGRDDAIDVKRHRGGIRDIEFLTQCLQRLYGASEPWLRSGGTLHALRKLNDKGLIGDRDFAQLTGAYEFLRMVEHRLQLDLGQQIHRLPAAPEALDRLALRAGVEPDGNEAPRRALLNRLHRCFDQVSEIYERVVRAAGERAASADFELQPPPPAGSVHAPRTLEAALRMLDVQAPELVRRTREAEIPSRARAPVTRFLVALQCSPEALSAALAQPQAFTQALRVLSGSDYLGELLTRRPEDLANLDGGLLGSSAAWPGQLLLPTAASADSAGGAAPQSRSLEPQPRPFPWTNEEALNPREKLAALRREFRSQVLTLGASDCLGARPVFEQLERWSLLAGRCLASAFEIARRGPVHSSKPAADGPPEPRPAPPLVALGLGRLGLNEFDLASDADLVFVVARENDEAAPGAWTRCAERMMEALASYTSDGAVFAVDTRLRPHGQEGELVVSEEGLLRYAAEEARPWEALSYLKAQPVAGSQPRADRIVRRLTEVLLERFTAAPELAEEVAQMRLRLERELEAGSSDFKTAPGGYYDIDFAVSYLRLRHRLTLPPGMNLPEQIAALRQAGALGSADAEILTRGAAFLRGVDHAVRLVTGKRARTIPSHAGRAEAVAELMVQWGLIGGARELRQRLRAVRQQVRSTYTKVIGAAQD